MRITTNMISNSYLTNLNTNLSALNLYQTQLSTGKRITKLSDDPVGVLGSMDARVKLARLTQYQKNVDSAKDALKSAETALNELNSSLQTAYERALQASTDTVSDSDRAAIAEEIKQLRDNVLSVGNTKVSNRYLFGGYNSTSAPFTLNADGDLLYNGLDVSVDSPALQAEAEQSTSVELGYDMTMQVSVNGLELLGSGSGNIYNLLNNLYHTLTEGGSASDIEAYVTPLQTAQSDVLANLSEIGGRSNRLDLLSNRYAEDELNYTQVKSDVEDVDQAEAIMNYKMSETVYLFALKVGSSIIQPSLVDYLK